MLWQQAAARALLQLCTVVIPPWPDVAALVLQAHHEAPNPDFSAIPTGDKSNPAASFFSSSLSPTVAAKAVSTPSSPTFCAMRFTPLANKEAV